MGLVDDGFVVGNIGALLCSPVEERTDDHTGGDIRGAVVVVDLVGAVEVIVEEGLVPVDLPVDSFGVRVDEEFVWVAA